MNKNDLVPMITIEECSEVIQAISKVFRFGIHQINPYTSRTNKFELETEIGQLKYMLNRLIQDWGLDEDNILKGIRNKSDSIGVWADYFDRKPGE